MNTSTVRGSLPIHGGDLGDARTRFPAAPQPWLDLSTGINPIPYPVDMPAIESWARLPEREAVDAARAGAAAYYETPDDGCLAAAPGSQAAIQWLPRLRPAGSVAVVSPTYGEHAACWAAAGHHVTETVLDEAERGEFDTVVVTNPNNPDGRTVAGDRLLSLAERQARRGGWLVVDEAFADVAPEVSVARRADRPGLIVLRSFGKFFGLAGVRLGFVLAEPRLAARACSAMGFWAVSGPALSVATAALGDWSWIDATRARLSSDRQRLDEILAGAGLVVVGGTDLFRLAHHDRAADLYEALGTRGILVRAFANAPAWLRFGLPGDEEGWTRLIGALQAWRRGR